MSRPVDWLPLRGSDPVPGDPDRVEQLGKHYRRVAEAINDAARKLRQIADHNDMQSDAVDAFRNNARKVADDISRAHERYDGVGQALVHYAPVLRDAQSESLAALTDAKNAQADLDTANRLANAAHERIATAPAGVDTTVDQGAYRRANDAAAAAGRAKEAAERRLEEATKARDTAADLARSRILDVKDSGDLNDSAWDNWGTKVVKAIVKVADIVAVVFGFLALIALFIPVIGPALAAIFGTIALVASLFSLVGNLALAWTGYGEWSEVVWAAIAVLSFGVGRAAVAGLRVSVAGARGAARMAAGRWAGQSPAVRAAAGLSDSRSSMGAIRAMLGTRALMSKNAAERLAKASLGQKYAPSSAEFGSSIRAIPGEFVDNLRTVRSAGWSGVADALRQTPQHVWLQAQQGRSADGMQALLRASGEADTAASLDDLGRVSDKIRSGAEVGQHMKYVDAQSAAFATSTGYSLVDIGVNTNKLVADWLRPSPAEQLHLTDSAEAGRR